MTKTPETLEPLLTAEQLADMVGVKKKQIYRWLKLGRGPKAVRIGNLIRFDPRDCREWLESRKG